MDQMRVRDIACKIVSLRHGVDNPFPPPQLI